MLSDKPSSDEDNEYSEENPEGKSTRYENIIESLPHVFRTTLSELTELFSDLKNSLPFDESILANDDDPHLRDLTNNKLMSFLLIDKLVLDMLSTPSFEFKVKLANDLRRLNFTDCLMQCLFRVMPVGVRGSTGLFQGVDLAQVDLIGMDEIDAELLRRPVDRFVHFNNDFVEWFACKLYKHALKNVPAIVRDWWNMQSKRVADQVDKFTTK